jgi:hypothetical protein
MIHSEDGLVCQARIQPRLQAQAQAPPAGAQAPPPGDGAGQAGAQGAGAGAGAQAGAQGPQRDGAGQAFVSCDLEGACKGWYDSAWKFGVYPSPTQIHKLNEWACTPCVPERGSWIHVDLIAASETAPVGSIGREPYLWSLGFGSSKYHTIGISICPSFTVPMKLLPAAAMASFVGVGTGLVCFFLAMLAIITLLITCKKMGVCRRRRKMRKDLSKTIAEAIIRSRQEDQEDDDDPNDGFDE